MPNENFNYDKISTKPVVFDYAAGFASQQLRSGFFIEFGYFKRNEAEHPNLRKKFGWKFHVSIDDHDLTNLGNGWNIVKDILIEYQVALTKVIQPGILMENIRIPDEPIGVQRGKQITIYAFCEDDGYNWQPILERITAELAQANIQPSFTPSDCQRVPGSHYISYRNDGDEHDRAPGPRNSGYNPLNKVDCFAELTVDIRFDQPPIPVWPGIEGEEILRPTG